MYTEKKINNRIDLLINNPGDTFFDNLLFNKKIQDKLYSYQIIHVSTLLTIFDNKSVALDCSDTGTGKTYTSLAICQIKKLIPFIICPKSSIYVWNKACKYFNIKPFDIINYESFKSKYNNWDSIKLNKNIIIIFDEVHKCKNIKSICGNILLESKKIKNKKLLLSATIIDKINDFKIYGFMLNLYSRLNSGNKWVKNIVSDQNNSLSKQNILKNIIFPYYGSKMSIKEIDNFPTNQIIPLKYTLNEEIDSSNSKYYNMDIRQKLEILKIDILIDLINEYLDNNYNIVIFVNFINTLKELSKKLDKLKKKYVLLYGDLTDDEKTNNIETFQSNNTDIIISTFCTGNSSISLHDINGKPRVSIISLPESSIQFKQSLGRIARVGSLSPAINLIPIYKNTYEYDIYKRIKNKLNDLDKISNEDF